MSWQDSLQNQMMTALSNLYMCMWCHMCLGDCVCLVSVVHDMCGQCVCVVYVWCGVCVVCEWVCSTDHLSGIQFFKLPPHIWHLLTQTWATSPSVPSPVPFGLSVISSFNSVPVAFAVLKVFSLWRSCGSIYWRHVFLVICKGLDGWVAPRWLRRALF